MIVQKPTFARYSAVSPKVGFGLLWFLAGVYLCWLAPLWPARAWLLVFLDSAGRDDYSLKQALTSPLFEEWLNKSTLSADSATRNHLAECMVDLREGRLLTVERVRGPLWRVTWTLRNPRLLAILISASQNFLAAESATPLDAAPKSEADPRPLYEEKLGRYLLAEGSGTPTSGLDYVDPSAYTKAVRQHRQELWSEARGALRRDLETTRIRPLEAGPLPRPPMPLWLWGMLTCGWMAGLAWLAPQRWRLS